MTEGDLSRVPVFHTNIIFNNQLLVQCQEGHVGTIPSEGNNRACLEEGALQHYVCGTQLKGGGKRGRPLQRARRAKSHTWYEYLKNRFRVATHQFSNRSQVMWKWGYCCYYFIFTSSVIFYWTDPKQHGVDLLYMIKKQKTVHGDIIN